MLKGAIILLCYVVGAIAALILMFWLLLRLLRYYLMFRAAVIQKINAGLSGRSALRWLALVMVHLMLTVIPLILLFPIAGIIIGLKIAGDGAGRGGAARTQRRSDVVANKKSGGPLGGSHAVEGMLFDGDQDKIRLARSYRDKFKLSNGGWFWGQFGK